MGSSILLVTPVAGDAARIARELQRLAYDVVVASHPAEALAAAGAQMPAAIVLDHGSPGGVDGVETCRRLKTVASFVDTPVLILSARGPADELRAFDAGAHDYMSTRVDASVVAARVRTAVRAQEAAAVEHAKAEFRSHFLATMSHELRTPLTAILASTRFLQDPDCTRDEIDDAIRGVRQNGDHLLQIINDILDWSKIEAGGLQVERIACSPVDVVDGVMAMMRPRAEEKGLCFEAEWMGPAPERIECDPTRLRQILLNFLSNALKFTTSGSVRLRGIVRAERAGDAELQFDVVDTGPGLSAEQIARLFRPFTQADVSTARRFGGTGLGLTISKQLAELLGGSVAVESTVGVGATFRVTIPIGPSASLAMVDAAVAHAPAPPRVAEGVPRLDGYRLLLAEDNAVVQKVIARVLVKGGAEVAVTDNGRAAVEVALAAAADGAPFDVVLMDKNMPEMDGPEAARLLRARGYTAPLIALTAATLPEEQRACLDAGYDDVAPKPVCWRELVASIRGLTRAASHPAAAARP